VNRERRSEDKTLRRRENQIVGHVAPEALPVNDDPRACVRELASLRLVGYSFFETVQFVPLVWFVGPF
jgi:hypothetical protein